MSTSSNNVSCLLLLQLFVLLCCASAASAIAISGYVTGAATYVLPTVIDLYLLQSSNISITIQQQLSSASIAALTAGTVDFAIVTGPLSAPQAAAHPNVTILPIVATALVPVYRLDALNASTTLTFSGATLALIYAGNITTWDHTRIQRDNPGVALPSQNISVSYQADVRFITAAWLEYLVYSEPSIAAILPPSPSPPWPLTRYASSSGGVGSAGQAAYVVNTDGSIGFSVHQAALQYDADIAQLVNAAGVTVRASQVSVTYTLYEQLAAPTPTRISNLTNCVSTWCWPVVAGLYVLLDNDSSPRGCDVRQAVSSFWQWYFQSTTSYAAIMQSYIAVTIPYLTLTQLMLVNTLQSNLRCNGQLLNATTGVSSIATVVALPTVTIVGPERLRLPMTAVGNFRSAVFGDVQVAYETQVSTVAMQQAQRLPTALPFYYPNDIDNITATPIDTTRFVVMPAYLTSIVFTHNLQLSPTVMALNSSIELVIDTSIIVRVVTGNISDWSVHIPRHAQEAAMGRSSGRLIVSTFDLVCALSLFLIRHDPALVGLNPILAELLDNNPAPITFVWSCPASGSDSPIYDALSTLMSTQMKFDPDVMAAVLEGQANGGLAASATCTPIRTGHWMTVRQEVAIPALVSNTVGAIGYMMDATSALGNGKFAVSYPYQQADGNLLRVVRHSNPTGVLQCAASGMDAATLNIDIAAASLANSECYPFSQVVLTQLPRSYPNDIAQTGVVAVGALQWLFSSAQLDTFTNASMVLRTGNVPAIRSALLATLLTITDGDGYPLLHVTSTWQITAVVSGLAFGLGSLAIALILTAMTVTVRYASSSVFRSSSPAFMLVSFTGLLALCCAIVSLGFNQNGSMCAVFTWCTQLGFTLVFAPLFAKAFRIYRIFGRRKLQVVKLTNRKLLAAVAVSVLLDVIYLTIWQVVAPSTLVVTPQYSTTPSGAGGPMETLYPKCSYSGTSSSFFLVEVVGKLTFLIVGVMLAFATWQVSSQFNESKSIGFCIYNLVFAIGTILPIIEVTNALGGTASLLMMFMLAEITYFTLGILFIPKLLAWNSARRAAGNSINNTGSLGSISGGSYSFLSFSQMTTPALLQPYIVSLKKHLAEAERVLGGMKRVEFVASRASVDSPNASSTLPHDCRSTTNSLHGLAQKHQSLSPSAAHVKLPNASSLSPEWMPRMLSSDSNSPSDSDESRSAALPSQAWSRGGNFDVELVQPLHVEGQAADRHQKLAQQQQQCHGQHVQFPVVGNARLLSAIAESSRRLAPPGFVSEEQHNSRVSNHFRSCSATNVQTPV